MPPTTRSKSKLESEEKIRLFKHYFQEISSYE